MRRYLYLLLSFAFAFIVIVHAYVREIYALRLWAWFAARDEPKRRVPFTWFLDAYDRRQAVLRGEM